MKSRFEFPLFYLLWLLTCMEILLAFQQGHEPYIVGAGIAILIVLLLFGRVYSGMDDVVQELLKPLFLFMVSAILISAFVSKTPLMLCSIGIQALILWRLEGGDVCGYSE